MNTTVRAPRDEDVVALVGLVRACDEHDLGRPDYDEQDLRDIWSDPTFDRERDAWVDLVDDEPVGYSWVWQKVPNKLLVALGDIHPRYRGRGIGTKVVARFERRARELIDTPATLRTVVGAPVPEAAVLMTSSGMEFKTRSNRMEIALDPSIEPAPAPTGVALRPLDPSIDIEAVYHADLEAFADEPGFIPGDMGHFAEFLVRRNPLSFVAVAGEEVAGFLLGRAYATEGYVSVLGVRDAWRKRGIATALLRTAFAVFAKRGLASCALGVDTNNVTGALRLYESVGMRPVLQTDVYEKQIKP